MSTNPFKAFIPYLCSSPKPGALLPAHRSLDPSGGQWRTLGLVPPIKGEGDYVDLQGAGYLWAVQFNERILPGKVRDEKLQIEVARIEALEGRKLGKKDYAQLRDQVEFDLLPKAFIRRTVVPVIFVAQYLLICTSSQKRADDVIGLLLGVFGEELDPWRVSTKAETGARLKTLAIDGFLFDEEEEVERPFYPTDSIVLKGTDKKVIRVKDKLLGEQDIREMISLAEYAVTEMGVQYGVDENEPDLSFVVTDQLIFKRLTIPDVKMTPVKEDFYAFAVLCAQTYRKMLRDFIAAFGEVTYEAAGKPASSASTTDEDDEL